MNIQIQKTIILIILIETVKRNIRDTYQPICESQQIISSKHSHDSGWSTNHNKSISPLIILNSKHTSIKYQNCINDRNTKQKNQKPKKIPHIKIKLSRNIT